VTSRWRRRADRLAHTIFDHYRKPRVLGLDILRITASLSIILFHGNLAAAFGKNIATSVLKANGYLAVDIFFVLSGWLLTRQVLRMRGSFKGSIGLATRFWARRWARIIPPYWFMLMLLVVAHPLVDHRDYPLSFTVPELIKHALFLQTFIGQNFYGVSWSLVTEEWFYLSLPFVVLLAARARSWRLVAIFGLAALLVPTAIRAVLLANPAGWDAVLVTPQARGEGLIVGALLAAASLSVPWWEREVMARRRMLFSLGLVLLAVNLVAGLGGSHFYHLLGGLTFNLSLGLLLPLMSQLRWPQAAPIFAVMAVAYLSELTYPLYLLHAVIKVHWAQVYGPMKLAYAMLALGSLFLAASLLHLGIERPFLAWRDRHDGARSRPALEPVAVTEPAASWKEPTAAAARISPSPLAGEGRGVGSPALAPEAAG
jgi:peptidoglycan/LPS O-acetylase OafA/YrhL